MRGLITGIHAILNKMEKLIKGDLKGNVMKEIDEYDPGDDLFVSCVDMLGLNSNFKRDE